MMRDGDIGRAPASSAQWASQVSAMTPRIRIEEWTAAVERLDVSLAAHEALLAAILRLHPDPAPGAGPVPGSGADAAKTRLRSQIARCLACRAELCGRIEAATALLPVVRRPMRKIGLVK